LNYDESICKEISPNVINNLSNCYLKSPKTKLFNKIICSKFVGNGNSPENNLQQIKSIANWRLFISVCK
jgi:hypothetical protein